ncbi:MAG: hypothetical protein O7157_03220 [Wolbachia endosymbiont of Tetragnatha montana]|nr:hypothetical protein [Wolbachia endosymbiont of Tetragnatha montana]
MSSQCSCDIIPARETGIPKKDDVILVLLFLSSRCLTLGSSFPYNLIENVFLC